MVYLLLFSFIDATARFCYAEFMDDRFSCRLCGECCSGDMKVFLNPEDLDLLCSFLNYTSKESLFSSSCVTWDEKCGIRQPRLLFREIEGVKFCPFLENRLEDDGSLRGLCMLHPHYKPLVCHLAPLTRTVDFEDDSESYGFVPPHPSCPGCTPGEGEGDILAYENLPEELKARLDREKEYFRSLWKEED